MRDKVRTRWFWVATICNLGATILLVLLVYASLVMLALFTSPVSMVPYFLIPAVVLILSIIGFALAHKQNSQFRRWLGYFVHTSGLLLGVIVLGIIGFLWSGIGSAKETYLIQDGYQGDVYVIYPSQNGKDDSVSPTTATYIIPSDGVFISQNKEVKGWSGWTKTRYFYVSKGGQRREITEHWDSTISKTPENLSNSRDIGIFFPTIGNFGDASGCHFRFEQFYVGTKAYLLRQYHPIDLDNYLREHQLTCMAKSN